MNNYSCMPRLVRRALRFIVKRYQHGVCLILAFPFLFLLLVTGIIVGSVCAGVVVIAGAGGAAYFGYKKFYSS